MGVGSGLLHRASITAMPLLCALGMTQQIDCQNALDQQRVRAKLIEHGGITYTRDLIG